MKVQQKRKVFLVDDEPQLLELFQEILSDDYDVTAFNSPKKFLKVFEEAKVTPFDVLITDLNMPGMTGIEMIHAAQKLGFHFPSILLSGFLDKNAVLAAVDLGVYRLLEKPTPPDAVMTAIEELLVEQEIRRTRDDIREITHQMREYNNFLRLMVETHVPETDVKNFALQTNEAGEVVKQESFESLMDKLEKRLDKLLNSENKLEQDRATRYKNIA